MVVVALLGAVVAGLGAMTIGAPLRTQRWMIDHSLVKLRPLDRHKGTILYRLWDVGLLASGIILLLVARR